MVEKFIRSELKRAREVKNKSAFYGKVTDILLDGKRSDFIEFGCRGGISAKRLSYALQSKRTLYTFDWFKGLPEDWHGNALAGHMPCPIPDFSKFPNIKVVEGLFQDTLEPFVEEYDKTGRKVYFIHFDADIYSSTKYALEKVWPLVPRNGYLLFDEFGREPYMLEHEYRAWKEFVAERNIKYRYILHHKYEKVLVRVKKI